MPQGSLLLSWSVFKLFFFFHLLQSTEYVVFEFREEKKTFVGSIIKAHWKGNESNAKQIFFELKRFAVAKLQTIFMILLCQFQTSSSSSYSYSFTLASTSIWFYAVEINVHMIVDVVWLVEAEEKNNLALSYQITFVAFIVY